MQQRSKSFSFRKTFRKVFPASEKNNKSFREWRRASILSSLANSGWLCSAGGVDPVSSGPIGGGRDVAIGILETSLAALQEGSALVTHAPFSSPVAGLILQALKMRGVSVRPVPLYVSGLNKSMVK
jgi:hypothetical protein